MMSVGRVAERPLTRNRVTIGGVGRAVFLFRASLSLLKDLLGKEASTLARDKGALGGGDVVQGGGREGRLKGRAADAIESRGRSGEGRLGLGWGAAEVELGGQERG
jgi:hypothetical protein